MKILCWEHEGKALVSASFVLFLPSAITFFQSEESSSSSSGAGASDRDHDGVGVLDHFSGKPGAEGHDGEKNGEEFDGEGEGLFLDLGGGLENGDNESEDGADDDRGAGEKEDQNEGLVG